MHASNGPNEKKEYLIENGNLQGSPTCPAISKTLLADCSSSIAPSTVKQASPREINVSNPDTELLPHSMYLPVCRLLALTCIADVTVTALVV